MSMDQITTTAQLAELLKAARPEDPTDVDISTVRYALYARKSTVNEDKQTSSVEDQIRDCMDKVVRPNNLNVVEVYKEDFSAKVSDVREEFNRMIRDIQRGRIDGVITWHPDRLSRNMKEAGAIIDLVDRGSIRDLRFATFNFENTPAGKMLLGITFVVAKQYSEHLSESVGRGNMRAVTDGEFIGKFKHGYIVDTNRHFQPDPESFVKVKHMFEMSLEGKSQKEIRTWINKQAYTVQKRPGSSPVTHIWSKDNVSELLRDPHYAGVHKWGSNIVVLGEIYDFTPMVSVPDFFRINKIDSLDSPKILSMSRPKTNSDPRANLLNGAVYCGVCSKAMICMVIDKKDKITKEVTESRYYFKCQTESCLMKGKSARGKFVIDAAEKFFETYLFVTKSNYKAYTENARKELVKKNYSLDSSIARLKVEVSRQREAFENAKDLLARQPHMSKHYDLDDYADKLDKLRTNLEDEVHRRQQTKESIATFKEYLKLFESTSVILNKIRDMEQMDSLLRIFFSNFTIIPGEKSFRKGSEVTYILKEPWEGFMKNGDFVLGAHLKNLLKLFKWIVGDYGRPAPRPPDLGDKGKQLTY